MDSHDKRSASPLPPSHESTTLPVDPATLVPPATAADNIIDRWVRRWTNDYERDISRKLKEAAKSKSMQRTPYPLVRNSRPNGCCHISTLLSAHRPYSGLD